MSFRRTRTVTIDGRAYPVVERLSPIQAGMPTVVILYGGEERVAVNPGSGWRIWGVDDRFRVWGPTVGQGGEQ